MVLTLKCQYLSLPIRNSFKKNRAEHRTPEESSTLPFLPFHLLAELRNVNSFTRTKIFKPHFTQEKRTICDILALQINKTDIKRFLVMNKCGNTISTGSYTYCTNLPKNGFILQMFWSFQTFYPKLPTFLH